MTNDFNSIISRAVQAAVQEALTEFNSNIRLHRPIYLREFYPLREIGQQYSFCDRTLYNYHYQGIIKLRTLAEGKTFVSVIELENRIRENVIKSKYNLPNSL